MVPEETPNTGTEQNESSRPLPAGRRGRRSGRGRRGRGRPQPLAEPQGGPRPVDPDLEDESPRGQGRPRPDGDYLDEPLDSPGRREDPEGEPVPVGTADAPPERDQDPEDEPRVEYGPVSDADPESDDEDDEAPEPVDREGAEARVEPEEPEGRSPRDFSRGERDEFDRRADYDSGRRSEPREPVRQPFRPPQPERRPSLPPPPPLQPASAAAIRGALDDVNDVLERLHRAVDEMEGVLETLEIAERQKTADEREIESLRRALRQFQRPRERDGGHRR